MFPTHPGSPVRTQTDPSLSYEALLALDDDVVTRGLSPSEMQRLERVRASGDEDGTCAPCMEGFQLNQPLIRLPCSHLYHRDCIAKWLENHRTCPTCRDRLFDDEDTATRPSHGPRRQPPQGGGGGRGGGGESRRPRRARFTMLHS